MYESGREVDRAVHPIYASQERDSAEAELRRLMLREASELHAAGYAVTVEVRFGGRGEEIVKYVQNHPVDLIAMTTHWRSGFQKLIFGSVAQYVARHVSTPIFLVHPDQPVSQAIQHGAKMHTAKAA
ncbi:MAG: universal stress protein [Anaerolineales bacterium]|nr:universal stress protein [Anaerolineales bacterium]